MNVVRSKYRLLVLLAGLVVFLSLLMSRVFWLQMVQGGELTQEAEDRRIQEQKLMPVRGTIYDCNHNELVVTVQVNTVVADPTVVREVAEKTATVSYTHLGLSQLLR